MTPNIRPMIDQAWAQRPDLPQTNTYQSCFELLQLILALAGPEWAHIGKSGGESGYAPPGFTPRVVHLRRNDGQFEDVTITHLSHDAAWHVPSARQVKIIVNSAANSDDRESIHGPAQKGGHEIEPQFYRTNNPPIPQLGNISVPPMASPVVVIPAAPRMKTYEELGGDEGGKKITRLLEADYKRAGMRGLDGDCGAWQQRVSYDFLSGICATVEESIAKHRRSWCQTLGISE